MADVSISLRGQGARDIVEGTHVREQCEILERHADAAIFGLDVRHILPVDVDAAPCPAR